MSGGLAGWRRAVGLGQRAGSAARARVGAAATSRRPAEIRRDVDREAAFRRGAAAPSNSIGSILPL